MYYARQFLRCLLLLFTACLVVWAPTPARAQGVGGTLLGQTVSQVAPGSLHTCVMSSSGAVQCWGSNSSGQTAVPPGLQAGGAVAIASGIHHSCALTTAGAVQCWGLSAQGQTTVPASLQAGGAAAIAVGSNYGRCRTT